LEHSPITFLGINVQQPWAELIVSGRKTVETRHYRAPPGYIDKIIALIETPGSHKNFKRRVRGFVIFGQSFRYRSREHFASDYDFLGGRILTGTSRYIQIWNSLFPLSSSSISA
jgi:hypothetical protein